MANVFICAAGLKGAAFLNGIINHCDTIGKVLTYRQDHDASDGFGTIKDTCRSRSIALAETRRPTHEDFAGADLVFLIGWQYLLPFSDPRLVVFHDSLLPRHRGFAPTVTALIAGDEVIGVTALRPGRGIDTGPIIAQAEFPVPRPARIGDVLEHQAGLMVDLARQIIASQIAGSLSTRPQDEKETTYSIWRDREDYFIDWAWSAEAIERFVNAVGYPYEGAHTVFDGQVVVVDHCAACEDIRLSIRQPGKVWAVEGDGDSVRVVCGQGMLSVTALRTRDNIPVKIAKIRSRFRTPTDLERQTLIQA
jgi:methionyl-tRNA formyltransferase